MDSKHATVQKAKTAQENLRYVLPLSSQGSGLSPLGSSSQQHALQLPDPALLWQAQTLCCLLLLQEILNVARRAQQDVSSSLHGEDGPSQNFPGNTAEKVVANYRRLRWDTNMEKVIIGSNKQQAIGIGPIGIT